MECLVPGPNIKVLGKALQALSKAGDELFIEARNDSLSLITLNSSKTVCLRFTFQDIFFSNYVANEDELKSATNATISCKIHMKILLPLFRGNLEKKLDFLKLEFGANSDFVTFKMKYKCDDIEMVHNLRLMDTETLSIGVLADSGSNNIGASCSVYTDLLSMFSASDDEVTLEISAGRLVARNYCVGAPPRPNRMRTQINLNSTDFLTYSIKNDSSINFSLKPFRTVVHFAESCSLNVELNFEAGGKPLVFVLKNPTFEVNCLVATLDPYSDASATGCSASDQIVQNKATAVTDEDLEALAAEICNKEDGFDDSSKQKSIEVVESERAKLVFGRCHEPTFSETLLGEVLAGASDSE